MITKITCNVKINRYNGLTRDKAYKLEKECLLLLEQNFKCICGLECYHFPIITNCIDEEYKFFLSDCGYSLEEYKKKLANNEIRSYKLIKQNEQIDCIISNLEKCKIKHFDMHSSGKNICINSNGILSIIDFDIASINDEYYSNKLLNISGNYGDDYYNKLKDRILSILNKI